MKAFNLAILLLLMSYTNGRAIYSFGSGASAAGAKAVGSMGGLGAAKAAVLGSVGSVGGPSVGLAVSGSAVGVAVSGGVALSQRDKIASSNGSSNSQSQSGSYQFDPKKYEEERLRETQLFKNKQY